MNSRFVQSLVVAAALIGCEAVPDPLPTIYETEHLLIGAEDQPLCAGDLSYYEHLVERAESELGMSLDERVYLSIWSDEAWPSLDSEYCRTELAGCAYPNQKSAYARLSTAGHELIHLVVNRPDLPPFFSEAVADIYSGSQTRFGWTRPLDNLELDDPQLDRGTGRHFVMWLRDTWGPAKLGELLRSGKHAIDRFESIYGLTLEQAQDRYFADAPFGYPSLDACAGAPLATVDGLGFAGWHADVDLDCEASEDTRVFGAGRIAHRTFDIPSPGYYSVSSDAEGLLLYRCTPGPIVEPLQNHEHDDDDVPPNEANVLMEYYRMYVPDGVMDLYFEAGKHDVGLFLFDYGPGEATLSIWPTLGPRPVPGGP